jgi:hypothetical protein
MAPAGIGKPPVSAKKAEALKREFCQADISAFRPLCQVRPCRREAAAVVLKSWREIKGGQS